MKEVMFYFVFAIALLVFFIVGGVYLEKVTCEARWADSGKKYDWDFFAGCRVEDSQKRLIPEKNLRDIQQ